MKDFAMPAREPRGKGPRTKKQRDRRRRVAEQEQQGAQPVRRKEER